MKNVVPTRIVAFITSLMLMSLPVVGFSQSDAAAIKYRRAVMKGQAGHLGAMFGIVKGGAGRASDLSAHARALHELTGMIESAFKQDTMGGKTRAKSKIWDDYEAFKAKAAAADKASGGIVQAVQSGDQDAIGKALGAMGKACKACHKKYRKKKQ